MADEEEEMKQVRFTKNYFYDIRSPRGAIIGGREYRAGTVDRILEAHARAAVKAGVAEYVERDERDDRDDRRERTRRN